MPLLLGLRLVARNPRRAAVSAASIAVTVTGIVAVLTFHATADLKLRGVASGLANPVIDRDEQMLTVLTVVLIGVPLGIGLFAAASHTWTATIPSARWLAAALLGTLAALAMLTSIPAWLGTREQPGVVLQSRPEPAEDRPSMPLGLVRRRFPGSCACARRAPRRRP